MNSTAIAEQLAAAEAKAAAPNRPNEVVNGRIFHWEIDQNSDDWYQLRAGKFTASPSACLLVDPFTKTGKFTAGSGYYLADAYEGRTDLSPAEQALVDDANRGEFTTLAKGAISYCKKLARQRFTMVPENNFKTRSMDRGHDMEEFAGDEYEKRTGEKLDTVGFIELNGSIGGSPDFVIVGKRKGVEIKSPDDSQNKTEQKHSEYLLDSSLLYKDHYSQIQFNLMASGFDKWDLCSFNPDFPGKSNLVIYHCDRDEEIIKKFTDQIVVCEKLINHILNIFKSKL